MIGVKLLDTKHLAVVLIVLELFPLQKYAAIEKIFGIKRRRKHTYIHVLILLPICCKPFSFWIPVNKQVL